MTTKKTPNDLTPNPEFNLKIAEKQLIDFAQPNKKVKKLKLSQRFKNAFSGHDSKTWFWIILVMFITLLTVASTIKLMQDSSWIFGVVIKYFIRPIISLGGWGLVLYFLFMGIQGVFAPLPSEVMLLSCGLLWGVWVGSGMALAGLMFAAVLAYEIGIRGGKPVAEKFIGDDLYVIDYYLYKYGTPTLLISRAIPVLSYDPISYAAGFMGIRRRDYYLTTLFGSIPRSLFFAFIGSKMNTQSQPIAEILEDPELLDEFIQETSGQFNTLVIWMGVILVVLYIGYKFFLSRYLRWKRIETELDELDKQGLLEEFGFSQYTMDAIISGEIPPKAYEPMGLFIQIDENGAIQVDKTIEIMGSYIIQGEIPEELKDEDIYYPYASPDQRLWLRLAKTYRLLLKRVYASKDPKMIGYTLEGLGHCYYQLGYIIDAALIFEKAKIVYYQAGNRRDAERVEQFSL